MRDAPQKREGAEPKLAEIAKRIAAHLQRFERDPKINAPDPTYKTHSYYCASSWVGGSRVGVKYVAYQIETTLSKVEALAYLAWLDAGNVGRHWEQQRAAAAKERGDG